MRFSHSVQPKAQTQHPHHLSYLPAEGCGSSLLLGHKALALTLTLPCNPGESGLQNVPECASFTPQSLLVPSISPACPSSDAGPHYCRAHSVLHLVGSVTVSKGWPKPSRKKGQCVTVHSAGLTLSGPSPLYHSLLPPALATLDAGCSLSTPIPGLPQGLCICGCSPYPKC